MMLTTSIAALAASLAVVRAAPSAFNFNPPKGEQPVTYYSLQYQDNLASTSAKIKGTGMESHFDPNLYVYPEMIQPASLSIDCEKEAMKPDHSDVAILYTPIDKQLPHENAWCAYKDGQGYVASRTHFPGVTADMIQWWLWWHSASAERYSLWHPWAHKSVSSNYATKFNDPALTHQQKLVGSVHDITEIIGDTQMDIAIHWKNASVFNLDESKFHDAGIVAWGFGEIYVPKDGALKAVDMIHLWYQVPGGLEQRSRYFLGNNVHLDVPVLGDLIPLDQLGDATGIKNMIVGRHLAHEQFTHDQQEMTHLAAILPGVYKEFGAKPQ